MPVGIPAFLFSKNSEKIPSSSLASLRILFLGIKVLTIPNLYSFSQASLSQQQVKSKQARKLQIPIEQWPSIFQPLSAFPSSFSISA